MKHIIFLGVFTLASSLSGEAIAACGGLGWSQVKDISGTLTGNTVCGNGVQEEHHGSQVLYDFKCGDPGYPGTAIGTACEKPDTDRRKNLGTWGVTGNNTGNARVGYTYTAFGSAGPYKIYTNGTKYDFCIGSTSYGAFTLAATISGSRVCP